MEILLNQIITNEGYIEMNSREYEAMGNVEREIYRGLDYIKTLIADLDKQQKEDRKLSRKHYLNRRRLFVDHYTLTAIKSAEPVLTDEEFAQFTKEFLKEVEKLRR